MSALDVKKFLDEVDKDPKLQKKLKKLRANWVKLGKEHGYHFSIQELHAHVAKRWGVKKPPEYDDPDTTCAA
jgi:predicted ribosomally synthesized peptide with nif11-like leader